MAANSELLYLNSLSGPLCCGKIYLAWEFSVTAEQYEEIQGHREKVKGEQIHLCDHIQKLGFKMFRCYERHLYHRLVSLGVTEKVIQHFNDVLCLLIRHSIYLYTLVNRDEWGLDKGYEL